MFGKLKLLLALNRAWERVKKESLMGHGKAAIFGLGAAVVSVVVSRATIDCPCLTELLKAWPSYVTTGIVAGIGVYLKSPVSPKEDA